MEQTGYALDSGSRYRLLFGAEQKEQAARAETLATHYLQRVPGMG
jgi:hypothetical protein